MSRKCKTLLHSAYNQSAWMGKRKKKEQPQFPPPVLAQHSVPCQGPPLCLATIIFRLWRWRHYVGGRRSTSILPAVIPAIWRRRVSRSWPPIIMTSFRSSRSRDKVALLRLGLLKRGEGFSGWTTEEPNNTKKKRKKKKKGKRVTVIYRQLLQKCCVLGVTES